MKHEGNKNLFGIQRKEQENFFRNFCQIRFQFAMLKGIRPTVVCPVKERMERVLNDFVKEINIIDRIL